MNNVNQFFMKRLFCRAKPAKNEIWYTNGSTTEATAPYNTDGFGANIVSNLYDAEKECWVIKFDGDVTLIGDYAFYGLITDCKNITSIAIPDSVTSIGRSAFNYCTSLKAFYGKLASEDNRCLIVNGVLNSFAIGCGATSYTIPDSVTEIGYSAFRDCTSLTSVTIPDSVTEIGIGAFEYCKSLKAFLGKFATTDNRCLIVNGELNSFAIGCGATSYIIPDSVTSIGKYAFSYCTSLATITIPDSVTSIGEEAFYDCTSLTSVTIPDSVTSIGTWAFFGCYSLTRVTIGNGVTEIGEQAFCGCESLTSITIPDSVTTISSGAFSYCTSLTSVTIPDSVTSIGDSAFEDCSSLKEVYCKPTTPPTGGSNMFSYYIGGYKPIGCKIYVPASDDDSIINAYKAKEYWSDYKSNIYEYNFSSGE